MAPLAAGLDDQITWNRLIAAAVGKVLQRWAALRDVLRAAIKAGKDDTPALLAIETVRQLNALIEAARLTGNVTGVGVDDGAGTGQPRRSTDQHPTALQRGGAVSQLPVRGGG